MTTTMARVIEIKVLESGVCLRDFDVLDFKQPLEPGEILSFSAVSKAQYPGILQEDWMLVIESEDGAKKGGGLCKAEFDLCVQLNTFERLNAE